jgi:hypothetical protein
MPPERRQLKYASVDEILVDVERLRQGGCEQCGNWTLPQACWHLVQTTQFVMRPGPYPADTPEQIAARPLMHKVLNEGMPPGIPAPDAVLPPPDAPASAVDDFVATMKKFAAFPGPFGPHRRFGQVGDDTIRRLTLAHAAHHLSHFVPKDR